MRIDVRYRMPEYDLLGVSERELGVIDMALTMFCDDLANTTEDRQAAYDMRAAIPSRSDQTQIIPVIPS